jgi:DNA repair protein RecO (recombination protein O)
MPLIEDKAFVLFSRPQGETSLWLSVLTQHHGRFSLLYKGGQKKSARCAPFQPIILTWKSTARGTWLSNCETEGFYPRLTGMANWSGLYVNDLLHKGLAEGVITESVFLLYQQLLKQLAQQSVTTAQLSLALRRFEWFFLQALGYGFPLYDAAGGAIKSDQFYHWHQDCWHKSAEGISGAQLLALTTDRDDVLVSASVRHLLQWRLLQVIPSAAMTMRQWWEQ